MGSRRTVDTESEEQQEEQKERRDDLRWALVGGVAAGVVGFAGMAIVGLASAYEARLLLGAVLPTARFAASAYVAGGATILALMLTLITFSISHDLEFRRIHYRRIRDIAAIDTAVIVGSVLLLMFLSFPLDEAEVNRDFYLWVYNAILLGGAVTGGLFISVVLMLFYAVRGLIRLGVEGSDSELIVDVDADDTAASAI